MTINPSPSVTPESKAFTQHEEGGYASGRADGGNWSTGVAGHGEFIGSNLGVGAPAAIAWMHPHESVVTPAWMRGSGPAGIWMPLANARYWRAVSCDKVHPALALDLLDFAWNRGPANSGRALQTALGLTGGKVDGDVGPITLGMLAQVSDLNALIQRLADAQMAQYRGLSNFGLYGKGWTDRTTRRTSRTLGLLVAPPAHPVLTKP